MSEAVPERGEGVPQDDAEAVNWHLKAAEQGRALAQVSLVEMYKRGNGVPQDYVEAVAWYRRAAEQGHALGQFYLGGSYERGEGVPQDAVQAHVWFNLAASRATIQQLRALAVTARDTVVARMTPVDLSEAQRLALEWHAAHQVP